MDRLPNIRARAPGKGPRPGNAIALALEIHDQHAVNDLRVVVPPGLDNLDTVILEELPACDGGVVGVNRNCYAMWGSPPACRVMFDPERRRLALKPCEPDEPGAYSFEHQQTDLPLRNLFRYYDVRLVETRRYYDPKVIDGVLVVDL